MDKGTESGECPGHGIGHDRSPAETMRVEWDVTGLTENGGGGRIVVTDGLRDTVHIQRQPGSGLAITVEDVPKLIAALEVFRG